MEVQIGKFLCLHSTTVFPYVKNCVFIKAEINSRKVLIS